ncbi:hypothetical protein H7I78_25630 [Citrobacter braakii]|uniref:Uncharacterized protein n=1 Tax=Citrobacter braakii TaxID=57706 RepID=A0ABR6U3U9_CITBR|nr:hypothetical protein [Citrobacter braakii]MBC2637243.1 hypothetical protein [Citrobacter braakii]MBC2649963.1 hypothetical protein [Citrobacter braakii]
MAVIEIWLQVLTDGGEVAGMQLDTLLWDIHTPPPRGNAECRKSQVHFCICDRWFEVLFVFRI